MTAATATSFAGSPLRVGVLGCSAFALRAMVPALALTPGVTLSAIASRDPAKAEAAAKAHGGRAVSGYRAMVEDPDLDVLYVPLPTGLHEPWVMAALEAGKHLLVEKSLAADLRSARRMLDLAERRDLLVAENFLFRRHPQRTWVHERIAEGAIGRLVLFRACFTIPPLAGDNFRYDAALGGGALLDVGAYMVKSVAEFLGPAAVLRDASIETDAGRGVDVRGAASWRTPEGVVAQAAWGFDTHYQCTWEFLGTAGRLVCERALTPPPGFEPPVRLEAGNDRRELRLPAANHYVAQWEAVATAVRDAGQRAALRAECLAQAEGLQAIADMAGHALHIT